MHKKEKWDKTPYEGERNIMIAKMKTQGAKEIYKIRGQTIEPVSGDIKENKGLNTFLTRGIEAVRAEFNMVCAARNLRRIWVYLKGEGRDIRDFLYQLSQRLQYLIRYYFAVRYIHLISM